VVTIDARCPPSLPFSPPSLPPYLVSPPVLGVNGLSAPPLAARCAGAIPSARIEAIKGCTRGREGGREPTGQGCRSPEEEEEEEEWCCWCCRAGRRRRRRKGGRKGW